MGGIHAKEKSRQTATDSTPLPRKRANRRRVSSSSKGAENIAAEIHPLGDLNGFSLRHKHRRLRIGQQS
jgi:hypothetical protein